MFFVPETIAVALAQAGFTEPLLVTRNTPLYNQVFHWLLINHNIHVHDVMIATAWNEAIIAALKIIQYETVMGM